MKIQAELGLCPLKADLFEETVERLAEELSQPGMSVIPGAMSPLVIGESEDVFRVISKCFAKVCTIEEVVLVAKSSNACPIKAESEKEKE